ncbi:MAG: glutamate-cysteine ligase family protein [Candidatus Methanomethylicia archaeon]
MIGPEHEYSINDEYFNPLPITDRVIKKISGRFLNKTCIGKVIVGRELQKHVVELKPQKPFETFSEFEEVMQEGIEELLSYLNGYRLLGLGMHPLLKLEYATVWDHRDRRIYQAYDRIFNIKQHGWLNIQSFQLNIPYRNAREAVKIHNKLRSLLPYIAALASASPICEEKLFYVDSRLYYYRINQKEIPIICNDIIPEKINSLQEYKTILESIYRELRSRKADILCGEWVNSRGVILRFSRKCLEIRVMDEQECIKSDIALAAFIKCSLKAKVENTERNILLNMLDNAIKNGTRNLKNKLRKLLKKARENADREERKYLEIVNRRIENGSLGELIIKNIGSPTREEIVKLCERLAKCLERNEVYS